MKTGILFVLSMLLVLVGAANPDRVGADDDRDRLPVAGDGHLLAGEDTVEDRWQRCSCFAG